MVKCVDFRWEKEEEKSIECENNGQTLGGGMEVLNWKLKIMKITNFIWWRKNSILGSQNYSWRAKIIFWSQKSLLGSQK